MARTHLKFYLMFLVLVAVLPSFARSEITPGPIKPGIYHFAGEVVTLQVLRHERVTGTAAEVAARAAQLINDGYECKLLIGGAKNCRKFLKPEPLPEAALQPIVAHESALGDATISVATSAPTQTNDSETTKEWTLFQGLDFAGQTYPTLLLRIIKPSVGQKTGATKLRTADGRIEFVVDEFADTLSTFGDVVVSVNERIRDQYVYLAQRRNR